MRKAREEEVTNTYGQGRRKFEFGSNQIIVDSIQVCFRISKIRIRIIR